MTDKDHEIKLRINSFRRKYYLNLALRGLIISIGLTLSLFLIINTLEYSFRFGSIVRAGLLFTWIATAFYTLGRYVFHPLFKIFNKKHGMNDEKAASIIGSIFPEIGDKLLNIIQLGKFKNTLAEASIAQKAAGIKDFHFSNAVDIRENKPYLKYLLIPAIILLVLLLVIPSFITSSATRIIRFNEHFVPEAPFVFDLANDGLLAFKNEDFTIDLRLTGRAIPQNAYIVKDGRKIKMVNKGDGKFTYTIDKIQSSEEFQFEAAGFFSSPYLIKTVSRPGLGSFSVYLEYPAYLKKKNTRLTNVGNLQIPEGTRVKWQLKTFESDQAAIQFESEDEPYLLKTGGDEYYEFEKTFKKSESYSIRLKNQFSENKDKIVYQIEVIPDQYPKITVNPYTDTTLFSFVALPGSISDDYGLSKLTLFYQLNRDNTPAPFRSLNIPIAKRQNSQGFYYQWALDSLQLKGNDRVKYFLKVWDNDGVNGRKSTKTGTYEIRIPSDKEIKEEIDNSINATQRDIHKSVQEAKDLNKKLNDAEQRLKGRKDLNWQDKNLLKDIVKKREALNKAIEELKEQARMDKLRRERFSSKNERLREKAEKLQELMNELLDEETKKLYEELQKLLEENTDVEQIQDLLNDLNNKEENLEKELERTLELFKRMKFDYKLNEAIEELDDQSLKQEKLIEETEDKSIDNEELTEKQSELKEDFKEFKESLDELEELNQELKNPQAVPDTRQEESQIEQDQEKAREMLEKNRRRKAQESQQKAQQMMQQMKEKMQQMQNSMQMTMMQENLDHLRNIVHNLLKLSFDQEALKNDFAATDQSDPRFVDLGQTQLKLKDDAQIVEDSLLSLANRVFQIKSFVTREVSQMNDHMEKSMEAIRERNKPEAVSEQQFAMTSMNNLALLLDDVLQQMQQAMAEAMGIPQKKKGQGRSQTLSELQQQLNDKIQQLKKSGKTGRALSEELAKLAAEQERIRQALQEMQEKSKDGKNGQTPGNGIPEKMEETEIDLINKRLTEETIKRQREILTRLLEAENAMRERELDEERKGETAKDYERHIPKAFEEYFKMKEKEIELLKKVPPKLYPYYKKEVNQYFKRLGEQPNK